MGHSGGAELLEVVVVEGFGGEVLDSEVQDHSDEGVLTNDELGALGGEVSSNQLDLTRSDVFESNQTNLGGVENPTV